MATLYFKPLQFKEKHRSSKPVVVGSNPTSRAICSKVIIYSNALIQGDFKPFIMLIGVSMTQNQNRIKSYEIALFGIKSDSKMTAL